MPRKRPTRLALLIALASAGSTALAEDLSPNLQINGFATAGFTSVTDDFGGEYLATPLTPGSGIDKDGSFNHNNVLGIQLTYQVDEKIDLVGQLISMGTESYDTRAEWAYLGYRVNDSLRLRAGRFAMPLYMYSESVRVGQAYPWARLPVEVYSGSPFHNMDAVDALYRLPLGDWDLNAQAYLGRFGASNPAYSADAKGLHGLNVTLGNGSFALRAGYSKSDVSVTFSPFIVIPPLANAPMPSISEETSTFANLGTSYDDGQWFIAAEASQSRVGGHVIDHESAYLSVGRYVGKWLPFVLAGKVNTINGGECRNTFAPIAAPLYGPATPMVVDGLCRAQEREQTSYSLGARYDLSKRASLKLQVDHVKDFHDTPGLYFTPATATGTLSDDDSTEVITLNINAAF